MPALQIYDTRERRIVAAADRALSAAAWLRGVIQRRNPPASPGRILLLRLERIGDLLMALPGIADVRELAPRAEIDLVVGSWNESIASAIPGVTRVETLDASWLSRETGGAGMQQMLKRALSWRARHYDLAINFEPDIRTNLMLAASGAAWTIGYSSGGGGPVLDRALQYDPLVHTTCNARRIAAAAFNQTADRTSRGGLRIPDRAAREAVARLAAARPGAAIGVHVSGGRAIKQWEPRRFAEVAERLAARYGAAIVLTGTKDDKAMIREVVAALPGRRVIDLSGDVDLLTLAAVLERLDLFVTGDTGPMHLAGAVGTPIVAIFGPSDPVRYGPRGPFDRVVRVDLPCSPCNRIRLPPARCIGHTPDCLAQVSVAAVVDAAAAVLEASSSQRRMRAGRA